METAANSMALVFVLAATGCAAGLSEGPANDALGDAKGGLLGNPAPDFSVEPLANARGPVGPTRLRGDVVIVDFWATYCGPCKASFPKLQAIYEKYASEGLRVVGISEDDGEDRSKITAFARAHGATFAIAWDADQAIARLYKPDTMPSSYVINRKGIVKYVQAGFRNGDEVAMEKEVRDLLLQ